MHVKQLQAVSLGNRRAWLTKKLMVWYKWHMKSVSLVLVLLGLGFGVASAKSWKGAEPGVSTKRQVMDKFGSPTRSFSKGGELSDGINYRGKQAIKGSLEANFYFDSSEVLFRIDVFPARKLEKKDIVRVFGTQFVERTAKTGHTVFVYPRDGMMVIFEKDRDLVVSFKFTQAKPGEKP